MTGYTTAQAKTKWHSKVASKCLTTVKAVEFYKKATWERQDEFGINYSKESHRMIRSCRYGQWVAHLWQKRAWKLRDRGHLYNQANRNFNLSAQLAHRVFPTITVGRLWHRADVEGGHGEWVWNTQGSHAGGWFQFMEGTYYGRSDGAFAYARAHGYPIPSKYNSFYSMLGQTVTTAYMFTLGLECAGEGWAASC